MLNLSKGEQEIYSRHFSLPGFSEEKQLLLKKAKVLVIGAGGLGSPCLLYLAGAGVGKIGIVDGDQVSVSNLPRQVLFDFRSVGLEKSQQAKKRIHTLNPYIDIYTYNEFLSTDNIEIIFSQYEIIVDCTDNFDTKYLIDETCQKMNKPLVYSSIFQFEGQVSVFHYNNDVDSNIGYRDLFPEPPSKEFRESCNDAGVIGTLPGVLGTLQANEVIKIITGIGDVLSGKVLIFDALSCRSSLLKLKKRELKKPVIYCQADTTLVEKVGEISATDVMQWYTEGREFALLDVRESEERETISLGGRHIPLPRLSESLHVLDRNLPLIIYCKSGVRSRRAVMYLLDEGFTNVMSLMGGVISITDVNLSSLQGFDESSAR
ncbi:ThiF family adenylyltransferase [Yersinia enterocolitica]|uniref:ThiF family adenylyltransferase n=1 Tax=Yersinia enterocolitica TaxID=630 RepID=UPI003D791340